MVKREQKELYYYIAKGLAPDELEKLCRTRKWTITDARMREYGALRWGIKYGRLDSVKWLVEKFRLKRKHARSLNNYALRRGVEHGKLKCIKWLVSHFNLTTSDAESINSNNLRCGEKGRSKCVTWLVKQFNLTIEYVHTNSNSSSKSINSKSSKKKTSTPPKTFTANCRSLTGTFTTLKVDNTITGSEFKKLLAEKTHSVNRGLVIHHLRKNNGEFDFGDLTYDDGRIGKRIKNKLVLAKQGIGICKEQFFDFFSKEQFSDLSVRLSKGISKKNTKKTSIPPKTFTAYCKSLTGRLTTLKVDNTITGSEFKKLLAEKARVRGSLVVHHIRQSFEEKPEIIDLDEELEGGDLTYPDGRMGKYIKDKLTLAEQGIGQYNEQFFDYYARLFG